MKQNPWYKKLISYYCLQILLEKRSKNTLNILWLFRTNKIPLKRYQIKPCSWIFQRYFLGFKRQTSGGSHHSIPSKASEWTSTLILDIKSTFLVSILYFSIKLVSILTKTLLSFLNIDREKGKFVYLARVNSVTLFSLGDIFADVTTKVFNIIPSIWNQIFDDSLRQTKVLSKVVKPVQSDHLFCSLVLMNEVKQALFWTGENNGLSNQPKDRISPVLHLGKTFVF